MRAAVVGVYFHDSPDQRVQFGRALAEVTHLDKRAIAGALLVSELAAALCETPSAHRAFTSALGTVSEALLVDRLKLAETLAVNGASYSTAAAELGTSGFVLHTVPFAAFALLRHEGDPVRTLSDASASGGDTDTIGAILGGWLGALHGDSELPVELLGQIHDGPFGPTHLRALGTHLLEVRQGRPGPVPGYSVPGALLRNLALYPVIIGHGFRRLLP